MIISMIIWNILDSKYDYLHDYMKYIRQLTQQKLI